MYYTPLMILKYFIGSHKNAKKEAFAAHEKIVEGWKDAIRAAEVAQEFWPLHITGKSCIINNIVFIFYYIMENGTWNDFLTTIILYGIKLT